MTLPVSGPLTMAMIRDEYGGTNPASMSQYYSGGPFVPAGAIGINGPIPAAGAIDFNVFYGSPITSLGALLATDGVTNRIGASVSVDPGVPAFPLYGTLAPASLNGALYGEITDIYILPNVVAPDQFRVRLVGTLLQTHWTSIAISGGATYLSGAASSFVQQLGETLWIFNVPGINFVSGQPYTLSIT